MQLTLKEKKRLLSMLPREALGKVDVSDDGYILFDIKYYTSKRSVKLLSPRTVVRWYKYFKRTNSI